MHRATTELEIGRIRGSRSLIGRCAQEALTRKLSCCTYSEIVTLGCKDGQQHMLLSFLRRQERPFLLNSLPNRALLPLAQK